MMKKYLMMGLVAIAVAACSNHDITYQDPDQATYEQAFINAFGKPAANHTWGFGSSTRAGFTRGSYPNGNMWEDEGWNVPPELTAGQKERVYKYFQCHTDLSYTDPGYTNFWIQQVYKGGTDPNNSFSQTAEKYTSANGGLVTGSDHMDHLEAVLSNGTREHIFNFNFGNCTDWGGRMLMTNSGTHLFGYFNSEGSIGHTDYTGLVSWEIIEEWGNANNVGSTLNDGWNRSFMGFDFEQIIGDDIFVKENIVYGEGGKIESYDIHYLTYGDLVDAQYVWDGTNAIDRPSADTQVLYNDNPIPVLVVGTNEYCGDNGDFDQNLLITQHSVLKGYHYNGETGQNDIPYYQNENCLDMTVIYNKLSAEYLPVDTGKGAKWVKVHGGADGYYSDWIVTLIEATNSNDPDDPDDPVTYQLRVMAEDLSAQQNSDFDFNDVVFDAVIQDGKTYIKLLAAGGTLPLYIGTEAYEVHGLFKVGTGTMVNTYENKHYEYEPVEFVINQAWSSIGEIPVMVQKGGEWKPINAYTGMPAAKFGCPVGTEWADEFQDIDTKWDGGFTIWVGNQQKPFWADWN